MDIKKSSGACVNTTIVAASIVVLGIGLWIKYI